VITRVLKRLAWAVFIVWAVTTVAFFLNNVLPGDPARMIAGPQARPADIERIRLELGLNKPVVEQYGIFMRRLVHGGPWTFDPKKQPEHANCSAIVPGVHLDFGRSYRFRQPVTKIIAERLPRTLMLGLVAIVIQLLIGVTSGVVAAKKRHRPVDHATVGVSLLGISAPTFLLGIGLQFVFAVKLRLLPLDGYGMTFADHARGIVLPGLTLGIFGAAYYTRLVRDEMIGLLKQDYVRTARAKGVSEWGAVIKHALRNALVPLVTVIGLELGAMVGGAIVTESIFRWPGLGQLSVNALLNRDGPVVVGMVIVTSTAIVLSSLLVDLCYAILDPRVRK
jgi:peptide/nickel transport system permease protein